MFQQWSDLWSRQSGELRLCCWWASCTTHQYSFVTPNICHGIKVYFDTNLPFPSRSSINQTIFKGTLGSWTTWTTPSALTKNMDSAEQSSTRRWSRDPSRWQTKLTSPPGIKMRMLREPGTELLVMQTTFSFQGVIARYKVCQLDYTSFLCN